MNNQNQQPAIDNAVTPPLTDLNVESANRILYGSYTTPPPQKKQPLNPLLLVVGIIVIFVIFIISLGFGLLKNSQLRKQEYLNKQNIVIVGNSFTYDNDFSLEFEKILNTSTTNKYTVTSAAMMGYSLADHGGETATFDIQNNSIVGSDYWDIIVVQEQSEIRGFDSIDQEYVDSDRAIDVFAGTADSLGAQFIIQETWGYDKGSVLNRDIYPNYSTMQFRLNTGFLRAFDETKKSYPSLDVRLSPVGKYWTTIMQNPPLPSGHNYLYGSDGQHPSIFGSMLAAATLADTIDASINWDSPQILANLTQEQKNLVVSFVR